MTRINLTSEFATRDKLNLYNRLYSTQPDPDRILREHNYNFDILRDLMTDPHLWAVVQQRKMQVMQMGYEIDFSGPAEIKNECIKIMRDLKRIKIIHEMLDALLYGFTVLEIMWEKRNDKLIPVDVISKPQEWFIFDEKNKLRMRKKVGGNYLFDAGEELPANKFLVLQNMPSFINPYGEKILSKCYWAVTLKRAAIEYWQLLGERYGLPYLVGKYAPGLSENEQDELLNKMQEMIDENVSVMPSDVEIEFKESGKYNVGTMFSNLIRMHNREISKAALTVTLTVDIENIGSYKASEVHKDMLSYLGIADKKLVEHAFNDLFRYFVFLNYGQSGKINEVESPRVNLTRKETIIEPSVERDKTLKEMGVVFSREYLKKRYSLLEEDFGRELIINS